MLVRGNFRAMITFTGKIFAQYIRGLNCLISGILIKLNLVDS